MLNGRLAATVRRLREQMVDFLAADIVVGKTTSHVTCSFAPTRLGPVADIHSAHKPRPVRAASNKVDLCGRRTRVHPPILFCAFVYSILVNQSRHGIGSAA